MVRQFLVPMILVIAAAIATPAVAQHAYSTEEEHDKQIVLDFYEKGLNQKDFAAASRYLGTYVQHNPTAENGPEGFRKFVEFLKAEFPLSHSEIMQVFGMAILSFSGSTQFASLERAAMRSSTSSA